VRRIWRNRRYVASLLVVVIVSGALLASAYFGPLTEFKDLTVNLGASFLGGVVTVLAIEPIIRRGTRPDEVIHDGFPFDQFLRGVERASYKVRILGAWPYVMDDPWRRRFLAAAERAVRNRVRLEILVLDPASNAAQQRADDLGGKFDIVSVIGDTLRSLDELVQKLPPHSAEYLETRIYARLPPARMYRYDARAISSFFAMGNALGTDVKHYETSATSQLAQFVDDQFELLWNDDSTRTLDEYLRIGLYLTDQNAVVGTFTANFVVHEDAILLETRTLAEHVATAQVARAVVSIPNASRLPATPNAVLYELSEVDWQQTPSGAVLRAFERKYGRTNRLGADHLVVYRLVPLQFDQHQPESELTAIDHA
jgi:hypothetical protein